MATQFIPPGGLPADTPVGTDGDTLGSIRDSSDNAIPKSEINSANGVAGLNGAGAVTSPVSVTTIANPVMNSTRWEDLHINIREFGASGSNSQTTGSISAGSAVISVDSIEDFKVGDSISVAGASSTGIGLYLVAKILKIDGLSITLDASADTSVTDSEVLHDDTDSINSCLEYLTQNGGGSVYFPNGTYNINKGLSDTSISSDGFTILRCPDIGPWVQPVTINLIGQNYAQIGYSEIPKVVPQNGVIIYTKLRATEYGSSIFYGQHGTLNDYSTHLNPITINVSNMTIRQTAGTTGPSLTALNFGFVGNTTIRDVCVDVDVTINTTPNPTIASVSGIRLPVINNYGSVILDNVFVAGYYSGVNIAEHATLNNVFVQYCHYAFTAISGNYMNVFNNVLVQECLWLFSSAKSSNNINVTRVTGNIKIEASGAATGWWTPFSGLVADTGGLMQGNLTYQINGFTGTYPLANAMYPALLFQSITGFKEQLAPLSFSSSPFVYTPANNGNIVIDGGTVTSVTLQRQGQTINLPSGNVVVPVSKSDIVTITYTDAPSVTFLP